MIAEEIGKELEKYTYDYFLEKALNNAPNDIDTREGSIYYDAIAPTCYELAKIAMEIKRFYQEAFVTSAGGEYLDLHAEQTGVHRLQATKAIAKCVFTDSVGNYRTVPVGARFSSAGDNSMFYTVISNNNEVTLLQAEEFGTVGNEYRGLLLPIDNIDDLGSAELEEISVPARNAEDDDDLRERVFQAYKIVSFGGNEADYYEYISKLDGVGAVQIYPTWDGGGTVLIVLLDNSLNKASSTLIQNVQNAIDPKQDGKGLGYAPIGHIVTVKAPEEKEIDVTFELITNSGTSVEDVRELIETAIENYFLEIKKQWDVKREGEYDLWVFRSQITARALSVPGVANVQNVKLNNLDADISMTFTNELQEVPVLKGVEFV